MSYLFGDSSPAPFSIDVLEALRDALDFACVIAACDQRVATADAEKGEIQAAADSEVRGLRALASAAMDAVSRSDRSEGPPRTAALANELGSVVSAKHEAAVAAVTEKLEQDLAAVDAATAAARDRYRSALDAYLLLRDPPFSDRAMRITAADQSGDGDEAYVARLEGRWDVGLTWTAALGVPNGAPWKKPLRVCDVDEALVVHAPRRAGFLWRKIETRAQKLGRLFVTKLVVDGASVSVELRAAMSARSGGEHEQGFDFFGDLGEGSVIGARRGPPNDEAVGPFSVSSDDAKKILAFLERLRALADTLTRQRIIAANLDGATFDGNDPDLQPGLIAIIPRIMEKLAPAVCDIDRRSYAADELILRRALTDGRREEIFVRKAALREQIASLGDAHRAFFAPLPLWAPKVSKEGKERLDEGYHHYASMLASDAFRACPTEDRRRALKRMVSAKPPVVSESVREAHRAAIGALQRLVLESREPSDYEMLGMAYAVIDEPAKANEVFRKAYEIERALTCR